MPLATAPTRQPTAPTRQPLAAFIIRDVPGSQPEERTTHWQRLVPAWIISGIVHVVLLSLFLLVAVDEGRSSIATELSALESKIDDDVKEKNLVNDDIGNDPDQPTNYNVDRIEEISVPGVVIPNAAIG